MQPAISQLCTLNSSFEEDLKGYADATGAAVEFWLTKLEDFLKTHSVDEVRSLLAERNLQLAAATYHGGLLLSQGDARRENWAQFVRPVSRPLVRLASTRLVPVRYRCGRMVPGSRES